MSGTIERYELAPGLVIEIDRSVWEVMGKPLAIMPLNGATLRATDLIFDVRLEGVIGQQRSEFRNLLTVRA